MPLAPLPGDAPRPAGARGYAAWAFASEQPGSDVRFREPFAVEDDRAAVEYWAVVHAPDGKEATIAGVALLRFDHHGRVVAQRDYWNEAPERREPPPESGP